MTFDITPEEARQQIKHQLVRECLGSEYIKLNLTNKLQVIEDTESSTTSIVCDIQSNDEIISIEGSGNGPIDAFYLSLSQKLSEEYCSLSNFHFLEFGIRADLLKRNRRNWSGSDAYVEAVLVVRNDDGNDFVFRSVRQSVINASLSVALVAIEYLINLERAVIQVHRAIKDAKKRKRSDIVSSHTMKMIQLVDRGAYGDTIRKQRELDDDSE
tara:strand:+ start:79 stop:717 length:639 start_codon:yes stop_codon:yes gene_type:complete